ncbi:hypothetical protein [Streptomyces sp. Rer75]|uniref:hypothetical protein n=1 Tax=unclassified Streptomyces TaxID=2593676 RepID=UPI0015CFFBB0|nr:hypothetical protein [Streptomyces sp. Rer75]QLH24470.1 hypothetical protein HYQ63_30695 [Streptomyces sp. Rer75]
MAFSQSAFEDLIEKINEKLKKAGELLDKMVDGVNGFAGKWYIPDSVAKPIIAAANKLVDFVNWILKKIGEFFKGVVAPVMLFLDSLDWQDKKVRGKASTASSTTAKGNLQAPKEWKGEGADAYTGAIWTQSSAAGQVSSNADSVATSLLVAAGAGLAFYGAIALFLVQFIPALGAAAAAGATGIGLIPAAIAAIGEGTAGWVLLTTASIALATVLGDQVQTLAELKGQAGDNSAFPNGHWPIGTA